MNPPCSADQDWLEGDWSQEGVVQSTAVASVGFVFEGVCW